MFDDVGSFRRERKRLNARMFASGISVFRGLEELEEQALKDGALPQKYKELIGLAVSIADACYG